MDTCLSKFEELKQRAEKLQYNDLNEQDDIMRKTSMYVSNCLENKEQLLKDLEEISFYPLYPIANPLSGYNERSWEQGRQELVNFLDTRIEEHIINKEQLGTAKLQGVSSVVSFWTLGRMSLIGSFIGGAFLFGLHFGNNRFDKEKIQLYNENIMLKEQIDSFRQTKVSNEI
jgi:hypothetical protein